MFLSHQISEAQIEASIAQSPASQLSLTPGIKSSYDSGAVSLAASDPNPSDWGQLSVTVNIPLSFSLLCLSGDIPLCLFQAVSVDLEP